mmetsp:Transcript_18945/g.59565  ORF Transcript_18945/g.59565 Transcript_18945/m.59565 type:complete len:84 (-) Transcript_18945:432-683(-)
MPSPLRSIAVKSALVVEAVGAVAVTPGTAGAAKKVDSVKPAGEAGGGGPSAKLEDAVPPSPKLELLVSESAQEAEAGAAWGWG